MTPRTPGGAPLNKSRVPIIAAAVLVIAFVLYHFLHHRESHAEHLAVVVTRALAANDMRPVEPDFNALRRPELENRAKVGRLSDFVNAEGAFKGVKDDTPSGSAEGYHHFIAHFDKGDLAEDLTLDADGKIAKFDVRPQSSQ
ncbi:MAG: hypothetical protein IAI49_08165 [Candidatus Eremiobacteraeota bacterium]|nr:hypothetical protein [Candidatus Eremiobacteraeota bacterium]